MFVFLGHPDYDFVYRCEDRCASFGNYVGIRKGESFVEPLPLTKVTMDWVANSKATKITGFDIDGDGVFHGIPKKKVFETVTKDSEDVFGSYPENLKEKPQGDDTLRQLKRELDAVEYPFARLLGFLLKVIP
jgi:hypothetical protein